MGITALSNNLTKVSSGAGSKINVGYKVQPTVEESSKTANCDTYESSEIAEKVKSQIKDRIANLKYHNILYMPSKPSPEENGTITKTVMKAFKTVVGYDGSQFEVGYRYNYKTGSSYDSDYLDVLTRKAAGDEDFYFNEYFQNMAVDIVSNFSTASTYKSDLANVRSSIDAVVEEMRENIKNGSENPTENLKTKINIGGVEWGFKDLLDTSVLIRNSFDGIDRTITMDYIEYAKMGLSIGNVQNFADKHLNKEQSDMVKSVLQARADYYDKRIDEDAEEHKDKWINAKTSEQRQKYYKYGYYVSATNVELRNSIRDLFASVGKSTDLAGALSRYNQLMPPALKASGVSESSFAQVFKNNAKTLSSYYSALSLLQK